MALYPRTCALDNQLCYRYNAIHLIVNESEKKNDLENETNDSANTFYQNAIHHKGKKMFS